MHSSLELPDELIDFEPKWLAIIQLIKDRFGKTPDLEAILFLIGIQELGRVEGSFSKEQKQDLMHIAVCRLLSTEGHYVYEGQDEDGWPHYSPTELLPRLDVKQQETLLKRNIIRYFDQLKTES